MRYRMLGRTGLEISEIGIGGIGPMGKYGPVAADGTSTQDPGKPTGSYRGNPHFEVIPEGFTRIMARAEELGVNFLDTAPSYGRSEEVFGHYLKDPNHRKNWVVCTKTGVCGSMGDGNAMGGDASSRKPMPASRDCRSTRSTSFSSTASTSTERVRRPSNGSSRAAWSSRSRG